MRLSQSLPFEAVLLLGNVGPHTRFLCDLPPDRLLTKPLAL